MYLQQTPGHCIDSIITDSIRVWEDSLKFPPQRNRLLCASGYVHAHLARVAVMAAESEQHVSFFEHVDTARESKPEGSGYLSDSDVADPDFIESTSEGEPFSSSDEADAELLEHVLESAYSSKALSSALDPAKRDSVLLFDKDMMGEMSGKVYRLWSKWGCVRMVARGGSQGCLILRASCPDTSSSIHV